MSLGLIQIQEFVCSPAKRGYTSYQNPVRCLSMRFACKSRSQYEYSDIFILWLIQRHLDFKNVFFIMGEKENRQGSPCSDTKELFHKSWQPKNIFKPLRFFHRFINCWKLTFSLVFIYVFHLLKTLLPLHVLFINI